MTVCIAALCDEAKNAIGLTDSMMTISGIETEPVEKIVSLPSSTVALLSGDVHLNSEIIYRILENYDCEINKEEPYKHTVKEIAELYRDIYLEIRSEKIEKEIISSYGLDLETWKTQQHTLSVEIIRDIINRIDYFEMPKIEVIIMGADKSQGYDAKAHIFVVENDKIICRDLIGYACVGSGGEQAELEFIQRKHTSKEPLEHTIITVAFAKKRAEKVAGVGKNTYMAFIVDEESEISKSGVITNGLLLERVEMLKFYQTFMENETNRKIVQSINNFIGDVKNNKFEELRDKHKQFFTKANEYTDLIKEILAGKYKKEIEDKKSNQ